MRRKAHLDALLSKLVTPAAPDLLALDGVGIGTAALLVSGRSRRGCCRCDGTNGSSRSAVGPSPRRDAAARLLIAARSWPTQAAASMWTGVLRGKRAEGAAMRWGTIAEARSAVVRMDTADCEHAGGVLVLVYARARLDGLLEHRVRGCASACHRALMRMLRRCAVPCRTCLAVHGRPGRSVGSGVRGVRQPACRSGGFPAYFISRITGWPPGRDPRARGGPGHAAAARLARIPSGIGARHG